jgi:hypothetical protein
MLCSYYSPALVDKRDLNLRLLGLDGAGLYASVNLRTNSPSLYPRSSRHIAADQRWPALLNKIALFHQKE